MSFFVVFQMSSNDPMNEGSRRRDVLAVEAPKQVRFLFARK